MTSSFRLAAAQLRRMRAMNGKYHARFFSDIRFTMVSVLALFALGAAVDARLAAFVPLVALVGAAQTAFDASYLIFSRHYAARLERWLNEHSDETVMVAADLEDAYLFPLDTTKVVTLAFGGGFTWFGFMTAFYTTIGVVMYLIGLGIGATTLASQSGPLAALYVLSMVGLTLLTLGAGWWWFVAGTGERRLRTVLDQHFPTAANLQT